jgi:DNA polymerase-1
MALLMLLDGNSLAYRAFFALPTDMATASGQVTNAVYGFTSMLVNLLKDHRPDHLAVAFDRPEPTFRHHMLDDYKAGRAETPDILRQQMGLVRQLVQTLAIPLVEVPGFEADDIIATFATQARDRGDDVIIVTGDRDAYQLVEDPYVKVLYNRRGVSDYVLYDEAGIVERTGVTPALYAQYASLRGDPSDNLPGVPGVGEKTAAKLINTYGGLDGIFAHLDELSPKLRQTLAEAEASVRKNSTLIPLVRDVPVEVSTDELVMGGWSRDEVKRLFDFLEFRTLWDRLLEATATKEGEVVASAELPAVVVTIRPLAGPAEVVAGIAAWSESPGGVALAGGWEGPEVTSALLGLAVVPLGREARPAGDGSAGEPVEVWWLPVELLVDPALRVELVSFLGSQGPGWHAHDAKAVMRSLADRGIEAAGLTLDTAIAAYLVDPAGDQYLLDDLAARYASVSLRAPEGPPPGQLDLTGKGTDPILGPSQRAAAVALLVAPLSGALSARGLTKLYDEVERPLVVVLSEMEQIGVRVDVEELRRLSSTLADEARRLELEIQALAGEPFVVNSTKQLREILYDKLGLKPQKKTKTGYSTDAQTLEKLLGEHPIIESLLHYREVEKLRSTYGESLLAEVAADGRIHATFNQTVARTGRLSSDRPNLHNIPVRSEVGRQFRQAFIPSEGRVFLVADYNQIELRVIAHLAQDPGLVEAFRSGIDIHRATAARIFGVDPSEVTLHMRSKAKMVSYGLAYGMEAYGLAQRLSIGVPEATEILDAYFVAYPAVQDYMERVVAETRDRGYTETLFGRRRQIPELQSGNYRIRQAGERQAMNAGIQGLAADIFKVALVRLDARIKDHGLTSRVVLQVHDEVIVEVPSDEQDQMAKLTLEAMEGAAELSVPLVVNVSWGSSWGNAKG